ncbi:MAG: FtsW/RodA/SpoVE family cell cycle protein, partial [Planctomycetota bacterium]|nr:FtsW/RodA/SpoVE family cell cycle protein [Planctomycetota bacterium]
MIRPGDLLAVGVLALLCVGVVMVNSAGLTVGDAQAPVTFASIVFSRSSVYLALAMAALYATSLAPVRRLVSGPLATGILVWSAPLLLGVCAVVYLPGIGREVNGAHRWLGISLPGVGLVSVQPSEIAKWGLVLVLACYAARNASRIDRFFDGLLPALMLTGGVAAIVVLEDLGTGALILAAGAIVLIAGGARVTHFMALAPIGVAALGIAILAKPYRVLRLTTFLNPYGDPENAGYHMIQAMVAVANGEVFGRGLGFGLQKFGYLPEDRTDFLFAVVCEELGVMGAGTVIFLYLAVIWLGWEIVKRERDVAMRLLGLGVLATFGLQT